MEIGVQASILSRKTYSEVSPVQVDPLSKPVQTNSVSEGILSKSDIMKEINGINKWLQATSTHVKFTLHEELNEYYVQVINDQTQEVIREIPSKKLMDMVAKFHEMVGILVDERG
ncbi:flagellar protein FlaG [Brevibacillus gelatini]